MDPDYRAAVVHRQFQILEASSVSSLALIRPVFPLPVAASRLAALGRFFGLRKTPLPALPAEVGTSVGHVLGAFRLTHELRLVVSHARLLVVDMNYLRSRRKSQEALQRLLCAVMSLRPGCVFKGPAARASSGYFGDIQYATPRTLFQTMSFSLQFSGRARW